MVRYPDAGSPQNYLSSFNAHPLQKKQHYAHQLQVLCLRAVLFLPHSDFRRTQTPSKLELPSIRNNPSLKPPTEMEFGSQTLLQLPLEKETISLCLLTSGHTVLQIPLRSSKNMAAEAEASNTVTRAQYFSLSALSPEVRDQIYDCMTTLSRVDHLNFLLSSKGVFNESSQSFFRRPLACSSQDRLIDFAAMKCAGQLGHVQTLSIQLRDIDVDKIEPILAQIVLTRRHITPYGTERDRVVAALRKFPNLRHITFLKSRDRSQATPKKLMDGVLAYLGAHVNIQSLRLEVDTVSIQELSKFSNLKVLTISGFGKATPRQIVECFNSMRNLRTLQLVGPAVGTKWRRILICQNRLSFITPAAIQQLPALRALEIFELVDHQSPKPVLLQSDMLKAVCRTHAQSLEDLTVSSTTTPDSTTVAFVVGLLMTVTRLYQLALTWPDMNIDSLDSLPGTIKHLQLAVSGPEQAEIFLTRLSTTSHSLPFLRKVSLLMINEAATVSVQAQDQKVNQPVAFGMPVALPDTATGSWPWEVKWGVWQPVPVD